MVMLVDTLEYPSAFITRVRTSPAPAHSVPAGKRGEYFVAFSRLCTHMGAHLCAERHAGDPIESIATEGVVRCPCHLTCFDLCHEGLVVIGQATSRLPQIRLERGQPKSTVQFAGWTNTPYG